MSADFLEVARQIAGVGRRFDRRGWVLGTSGNFSVVRTREPLRLAITASAAVKGSLTAYQILEVGADGAVLSGGAGTPSAETRLHLEIAARRAAGAVLHTHSVWSTILSDLHAAEGGLALEGYEMLKGLEGVTTHEHREWLPILENAQDMRALAGQVAALLDRWPAAHGFLIRRHGLYTWGADLPQATRHVEILEFLLETLGRMRWMAGGGRRRKEVGRGLRENTGRRPRAS